MEREQSIFNRNNLAICTVFFLLGLSFATWTSRIAGIQEKLIIDDGLLGVTLFAMPLGMFTSLPISGWLTEKYSSRNMAITGIVSYGLTLLCITICQNVFQLPWECFFLESSTVW